jgi:peptidyl-prolyl cis-trans isomerase SurA
LTVHKTGKLVKSVTLLAVIALASSACTTGGGADAKDGTVAATVNGKKIMLAEVEKAIGQQTQGQQAQLSTLQLAQARLQVLDGLIQQEVLLQRAEKENLRPSEDEITQYINGRKREGGLTEEEFQKQLKAQNETEQTLREDARKLLAIQKLQSKYTGNVNISDREVEEYYQKNTQLFAIGRGVELADIVSDGRDSGAQDDAKTEAEAKLKIDNIHQQLKNADFAEVARARSEDPSNVRGGDIGFATEDALKQNGFPETLIAKFFSAMQVGDYTEPVSFGGRWYIFKLKRKQLASENRTLESPGVRQEIREALHSQRQQILNLALLEVAMREAKIVNNLAANLIGNPGNLGLRPASSDTAAPQASPAASPVSSATPAAAATLPAASPKASGSPK